MNQTIQLKQSSTVSDVPATLLRGEMAVNTADEKLYVGDGESVIELLKRGTTTTSGILKGNGSTISAAVANTDYVPAISPDGASVIRNTNTELYFQTANINSIRFISGFAEMQVSSFGVSLDVNNTINSSRTQFNMTSGGGISAACTGPTALVYFNSAYQVLFTAGNMMFGLYPGYGIEFLSEAGTYIQHTDDNGSWFGDGVTNVTFGSTGQFACNGATPQAAATVRAAATDLASALTLVNQLRAALIANGIAV